MVNNDNDNVNIALCKVGSDRYGLTESRYYIVYDKHVDEVDNEHYMSISNNLDLAVTVKSSYFGGVIGVSRELFATLNK